jgi:hypothetical protein
MGKLPVISYHLPVRPYSTTMKLLPILYHPPAAGIVSEDMTNCSQEFDKNLRPPSPLQHIGLKRKFSFSHFRENFRENLFSFSRKFLNENDENSGNFRESFRKNAKSVIFTTYFNFCQLFYFKMPTLVNSIQSDAPFASHVAS